MGEAKTEFTLQLSPGKRGLLWDALAKPAEERTLAECEMTRAYWRAQWQRRRSGETRAQDQRQNVAYRKWLRKHGWSAATYNHTHYKQWLREGRPE